MGEGEAIVFVPREEIFTRDLSSSTHYLLSMWLGLQFKTLPKKRIASAALFLNDQNEILIVKPIYQELWLLPGGVVEERESPRQACIREVKEELGLDIVPTLLLCVDYKVQQGTREEGIQFVFFGGILPVGIIEQIQLQADELREVRFVQLEDALVLLNLWSARRLPFTMKALQQETTVYLEDGQPIE